MDFLKELEWRGMLHQRTPGIEEALTKGKAIGYIGFDPTAPSMTIGNYVQIMLLSLFQRSGHQPIVLMGGATGRVGDPSGKDKERELKSYEVLDHNLSFQVKQIEKFLDFEGDNPAIMVNNYDFYKNMNVLDFLRDVGKTLTINYMTSKESVKKRVETGLSFTEFSYQLLQAYDFQCLYQQYNCAIQMGGSDQWGNITSGTEFIRKNLTDAKAYAVTTPLLTKSDGTKFGKSTEGNIWLDPNMTSPYKFYQFWLNADDSDIRKMIRYFTFKSKEEVEALEAQTEEDPRILQKALAEEITKRVHSEEDYESVLKVSELLFNKKADNAMLKSLSLSALDMVAGEIPCFTIEKDKLANGINILDFLAETTVVASKSEAQRAIKGNAIAINKNKISNKENIVNQEALLHGTYLMVENGRKNKFIVRAV
ncbi:MAG: tyrosyl-tRNA synthetase [Polaribacter sp.]|jgi:tyrosyl-tRNA synthetase